MNPNTMIDVKAVKHGDYILDGGGNYRRVVAIYPGGLAFYIQFEGGGGWHCPSEGKVFVRSTESQTASQP